MKMICPEHKKICYPTERHAIRSALASSRKRGTPLRVYRHKACGSFHLTSKKKEQVGVPRLEIA